MPCHHEFTGKLEPGQTLGAQRTRLNHTRDKAAAAPDMKMHSTTIATFNKSTVMAITAQVNKKAFSLAAGTSFAVNILSCDAYNALKRSSRGCKWKLQPSDLNLSGVTGSNLQILGKVSLPLKLSKRISPFHTDFYVTNNFGPPVDGLLGLTTVKTHGVIINTLQNSVSYCRRTIPGMEELVPLAAMFNLLSPSERTQETIHELHHTTPVVYSEDRMNGKAWKNILLLIN